MEKIKINMISGTTLEKPLITAFKGNGGEYVVLDNETNGTMGLPIILVSKLENGKLGLINDAEWNQVKEHLRLIIAGNSIDYIRVDETLSADDMFFKQLTLPVASFEALKNNYKPLGADISVDSPLAGNNNFSSVGPMPEVMNQNVAPAMPSAPEVAMPQMETMTPQPEPIQPMPQPSVAPDVVMPTMPENNVMSTPEMVTPNMSEVASVVPNGAPVEPVAPVMPSAPVDSQVVSNVAPSAPEVVMPQMEMMSSAPVVEPIPEVTPDVPVDFTADKEAFLKACENMFDALVAKMKN